MILWQFQLESQCRHGHSSSIGVQYTFQSQRHSKQLRDYHQRRRLRPIRPVVLLALLLFVHNIEVRMCRTLKTEMNEGSLDEVNERLRNLNTLHVSNFRNNAVENIVNDKRGGDKEGANTIASQPEEIFSAPSGGEVDMNYDEYPMVVPKRAALLLDRLMVALHHALEQERSGHRISQFYANQGKVRQGSSDQANMPNFIKNGDLHNSHNNDDANDGGNDGANDGDDDDNDGTSNNASNNNVNMFHMYIDDDPNVMMDYDFKDLNSINRATGETLMAKSFQRRANMGGGSGGIGVEGMALLSNAAAALNLDSSGVGGVGVGGGGRRINIGTGGRMYWRCYFNAVSCF